MWLQFALAWCLQVLSPCPSWLPPYSPTRLPSDSVLGRTLGPQVCPASDNSGHCLTLESDSRKEVPDQGLGQSDKFLLSLGSHVELFFRQESGKQTQSYRNKMKVGYPLVIPPAA